MNLQYVFYELLASCDASEAIKEQLWDELLTHYTDNSRHYHTIQHLDHMYFELLEVKDDITDWQTVLFSLFYHDVIYNVKRSDNELKSADLAAERIKMLGMTDENIAKCKAMIIVSKEHQVSEEVNVNYFLDADLSILGSSWEKYKEYSEAIRKEYHLYPDFLYKPGRRKVLKHLLSMEKIFKTEHFHDKYELQAKKNLQAELNELK